MHCPVARTAGLSCSFALALALGGCGGSDSVGDETPRVNDAAACNRLNGETFADNTSVTSATYETSDVVFGNSVAKAPFCRLTATARPSADSQIQFEVWLPPMVAWNQKFQAVGSDSSAGSIATAAMTTPLSQGYAVMAQDNGHVTNTSQPTGAAEQTWALGHPEKIVDFAYRAQHVTTVHAKDMVGAFYGRPPAYSYFVGCGQGGHHGLMEAARYPDDYDGIVAGAPAWEWFNLMAAQTWNAQPFLQDSNAIVAAKNTLLNNAVVAACDANDGVSDGVIADPRTCNFDAGALQCTGADGPNCLTAAQVSAAQRIYSGAKQPDGTVIFPPYTRGSEFDWSPFYSTADAAGGSSFDYYRYTLFQDPAFSNASFDFGADYDRARAVQIAGQPAPEVFNAGSDLTAFRQSGGKLIVYHGWADPQVSPLSSIDYHDRVVADEGANTSNVLRMFLLPGMGHCSGGPGPRNIGGSTGTAPVDDAAHDVVRALDRWVTQGTPPETMIASRLASSGAVTQTRPLCAWPKAAVYKGSGSTDDAASFTCQ